MHVRKSLDLYHRLHIPESFNVHLGTLQMISIIYAFIFAVLVAFLMSEPLISEATDLSGKYGMTIRMHEPFALVPWTIPINYLALAIVFLVVATMSLLTAMLAFHATLINVYVQWRIYFPCYFVRTFAGVLMTMGIFATAFALMALLAWRGFYSLAELSGVFVLTWVPIIASMARKVRTLSRVTGLAAAGRNRR